MAAVFTWTIKNFSYCWHKSDEAVVSPMFSIYMPEETKWKLLLFPNGVATCHGWVSVFLFRDKDCNGAENINVNYSLDILKSDGKSWTDAPKIDTFQKGMRNGFPKYFSEKSVYVLQDNLIIRCKISQLNSKTVKMPQISDITIIGVVKLSFQCPIGNFSNMVPDKTQSFVIKSESKEVLLQINFALTSEENICFGIVYFEKHIKFSAVKTFIINSQKLEIDSGVYEHWFDSGKYTMFPLKLSKSKLMENKSLYLPNDVLTLSFQLTLSTGITFEEIKTSACECSPCSFPDVLIENRRKCITHQKITDCTCALIADLTSLFEDKSTCDMKLQTKTNMFPVHTFILRARSPVFKAMFSSDMKEKLNGCVDVSDLHEDTVRRFLLYLYSDQLEDIKWDDAVQLYKAADKYAVISLRDKCSMFFKSNLNVENACEALMLSDLHQDQELKEITQTFILKNAKVIFKSEEWKLLAEANSKLALETTLRNWNDD